MRKPTVRARPRIPLETPLPGRANGTERLVIMDVSEGGAMIEHHCLLRPGMIVHVSLSVPQGARIVRGRVAWSRLAATGRAPSGARHLVYRSGIEFLDPPDSVLRSLLAHSGADASERPKTEEGWQVPGDGLLLGCDLDKSHD